MDKEVRIGYQGEPGAFSEAAALHIMAAMKKGVNEFVLVPTRDFPGLFGALADGSLDFAVIAIENSMVGPVLDNYMLLSAYFPAVQIKMETSVRIVHNLIGPPGVTLASIRYVYSHLMALKQCQRFFERSGGKFLAVEAYDTAGSVKMVIEEARGDSAAIAGESCAKIYGGEILMRDIGIPRNYTRFYLIGPTNAAPVEYGGIKIKTSLSFIIVNRPKALVNCLIPIGEANINFTKLETYPITGILPAEGEPFEYVYYLDFICNASTHRVNQALAKMRVHCTALTILGCYPVIPPKE